MHYTQVDITGEVQLYVVQREKTAMHYIEDDIAQDVYLYVVQVALHTGRHLVRCRCACCAMPPLFVEHQTKVFIFHVSGFIFTAVAVILVQV